MSGKVNAVATPTFEPYKHKVFELQGSTMKSSLELREKFLTYMKNHGHQVERSAPLIPYDDATLLFVNAGMVPFKNVFLNKETRAYKTATSSQKCVRAGGKHNDLENVGQTARHHTFFEMLGNFSFGDYFKEGAITLAWNFLTKELGLDKNRLSVSIFAGDAQVSGDEEAFRIWHEVVGLPKEKIKRLGRADNFWQMGDTGPCGPCTEIHYDRSDVKVGFGAMDIDEQVVEIWNLVFMQYEMQKDGTLTPLPYPCVDTGMGLERLTTVVNGLKSNYDTDLLRPMVDLSAKLAQKTYLASDSPDDMAMRVIADHARATAFLVADGLMPSNEGRGYVLRRIMRRAIRHGAQLGLKDLFFYEVCLKVVDIMSGPYPELVQAKMLIEKVAKLEEETFRKTLDRGLILFADAAKNLKPQEKLSGHTVFKLHETYGFPPDLTEILALERGLNIDWAEFDKAKSDHEQKSSHGLGLSTVSDTFIRLKERFKKSSFKNQESLENASVLALINNDAEVANLAEGEEGVLVLDITNFYGESGGQLGDQGLIKNSSALVEVLDTKKSGGVILHLVKVKSGSIKVGDKINTEVDWPRRQDIMRNHSATHLLHAALRQILGDHVMQKGSLVAPDRLRFDFAHFEAVKPEQLVAIETLVNEWILANEPAKTQEMTIEEAKAYGALALFGEKYEEKVRVLDMGSHSIELCGGTHASHTGDIGLFKITSESPLAQGIRRLEAITGTAALKASQANDLMLKNLAKKLSVAPQELPMRLDQIMAELKAGQKELKAKSTSSLKDKASEAVQAKTMVGSVGLVTQEIDFITDMNDIRTYADLIRDSLGSGVVALGVKLEGDKCLLLVAVTKDLAGRVHAGELVKLAAPFIDGKGGGRPDFAQAGGTKVSGLNEALNKVKETIH